MASTVLSRRERGQKAKGDARPNGDLRKANPRMHEFLALLGHELRSPLTAISNALHVLERQGEDAATREWVRSVMVRQPQCIGRLVEDMLEVSPLEHGKIHLRKELLDLAQTVARAVETARVRWRDEATSLMLLCRRCLDADPAAHSHVLVNLG